jgi:hypothetical protein
VMLVTTNTHAAASLRASPTAVAGARATMGPCPTA